MVTPGVLVQWHEDEGWGVIASPDTPGGCWVHYSAAQSTGVRQISRGQHVLFEWERCKQDGYEFRAVSLWIEGEDRRRRDVGGGPSEAYGTVLEVRPDVPDD